MSLGTFGIFGPAGLAGSGLGAVPGLSYPEGFPPTTPQLVADWLANAKPDARNAVVAFFGIPERPIARSGTAAGALLEQFANLAWNARERSATEYAQWVVVAATNPLAEVQQWLPRWQDHLHDLRSRWDNRYASYQVLQAVLHAQPALTIDASLEAQRQILAYAGLADFTADFLQQTLSTLSATHDHSLDQNLALTADALSSIVSGAGKIASSLVGGLLGGVPWWVWASGAGFVAWQIGLLDRWLPHARRANPHRRRRRR